MKSSTLGALILAVLITLRPATAQDVSPPENARVLQGPAGVVLQWPGSEKAHYFVQIYTGQLAAVEQQVTGNSIAVPLRAGLGYQWKVNLVRGGAYEEVVSARNFQVLADTQVVISGPDGAAGGTVRRSSRESSLDGKAGGPGPSLTATLQPIGRYVRLTITGAPANRQYFFSPGSAPLLLAARGGRGGSGGPGYDGRDGYFNYITGYITLPEQGGNGGNSGDGGPGGTITVISNGLDVPSFLSFEVAGGAPGAPGPGGRGGTGVIIPPEWQSRPLPQGFGYGVGHAPPGFPGSDGRPGPEGKVFVR